MLIFQGFGKYMYMIIAGVSHLTAHKMKDTHKQNETELETVCNFLMQMKKTHARRCESDGNSQEATGKIGA